MNSLTTDPQQPLNWSAQLGRLAASTSRQPDPAANSSRLPAALAHLLRRRRAQEDAAHKLKAHEFMASH